MLATLELINYVVIFLALYFEVFLLVSYFEHHPKKEVVRELPAILPSVTVMVPVWNEEKTVVATMESILKLDYPEDKLQVFAIDDGSTDHTWEVLQKFKNNPQVRLLQKENGGKHTALNYGLQYVKTELVGCLDADSFVDREALKRIIPRFHNPHVMSVTPAIKIYEPQSFLEMVQKAEYYFGIIFRNIMSKLGALYVTPGPFSIFRKQVFDELGGYRKAHNTEDMDIAMRIQERGYLIENAPDAFIYTVPPKTIKALYKQRLRWTYGFFKNILDYKHMYFNPKYGNLGVGVLPAASFSILSTMYIVFYGMVSAVMNAVDKIVEISVVGIQFHSPTFDLFFFNTGVAYIVGIVAIGGTLFLILSGKKIAYGNMRPSLDILYFMTVYSFIAPFWVGKALYNVAMSKKTTWR